MKVWRCYLHLSMLSRFCLLILFVSFFFLNTSSHAATYDPKLHWKTVNTPHFSIHYYEGEEEIARRLVPLSEEVYETLSKKFDVRPWGRTEVVVIDSEDLANGFTSVFPYNLVILRVVPPLSDSSLADYDDWLKTLFTHELTHVVHLNDTGYPAKLLKFVFGNLIALNGLSPGWVSEGIATYFETAETPRGRGRSSFNDMLLRTDILQEKFLHLDQMAGTMYDWPRWMAQYHYGVGFWQYLSATFGEEKIIEFSHKYGASPWLMSLNNKAVRVFKKSFYQLWKDWKKSLEGKYFEVKQALEEQGLREGENYLTPKKGESFSLPTASPDGKKIAYVATSVHHPQQLRLRDLETGKEKILLKKKDVQQATFSPDGKKIVVSHVGSYQRYYERADLYAIVLENGRLKPLTKGKRARDPDYSADGKKIVAVIQGTGFSSLEIYDPETKKWQGISTADAFDHPRWLPDGKSIVVSVHRKGQRNLWIIDAVSKKEKKITSGVSIDDRPAVDFKNRVLYFSSDQTGIPNIYRYDLKTGRTAQVTNVLTGAFAPTLSPRGEILFQYYNGKGFELRTIGKGEPVAGGFRGLSDVAERREEAASGSRGWGPATEGPVRLSGEESRRNPEAAGSPLPGAKNYNPFRKLFIPRHLLPNLIILDKAIFVSATVSNFDPLYRHYWFGDVTFRSDNNFIGFDVGYTYNRYRTPIFVGFGDFSVNYGDVFGVGTDFFEERRRGYGGIAIPFSSQRLAFNYFFEDRSEQSGLPPGTTLSTLGHYAGFYAQYSYRRTQATAAAISPEGGDRLIAGVEVTNSAFGASDELEQFVVGGDARKYLLMPYSNHHVVALRAGGGAAFGDQLLQGNFVLGGSLGESPVTGSSTRLFTLRGLPLATFSRDRVWVASAEYRLPLYRLQRGLGTMPFALNSIHAAFFADVGDAFNRDNASFRPLLGVGGEIRGDFVVGWHLPIMGRLGYGIIMTNRDRIAGVQDSLTGADARNGVLILELGTSY